MEDLLYVVITCALIGIAVLFVLGCEKIVGPDEAELIEESDAALASERVGERVAG
jgi:hypothetical protein